MATDTITPDEHALLRFPADVPGLLRRGSPVWMAWLPAGAEPVAICSPHRDSNGEHRVCVSDGSASPLLSLLSLDLTDATGRAHLAWWLAVRMYEADGPYITACVLPGRAVGPLRFGLSTISADEGARWRSHDAFNVTDHLDPHDPRLLPDGSRLVDALALSLVARHVAGLEVTR